MEELLVERLDREDPQEPVVQQQIRYSQFLPLTSLPNQVQLWFQLHQVPLLLSEQHRFHRLQRFLPLLLPMPFRPLLPVERLLQAQLHEPRR